MAAIRFQCDACQHSVVADVSASGSEVHCPNCRKSLIVPKPSTLADANAGKLPPMSQAGPAVTPQTTTDLPEIQGYEILAKIGEGGMGTVYKAREPMLNRVVALKVMSRRFSDDGSFVARFVREAAAAANLSHPNMVKVFTAGEANKIRFITMEFVEGRTLSQHIAKHGRLDVREAVAVTTYVAQALQHAWSKARLIHRDIKPENIFLSYGGEVKVGDLGLAKVVGETNTDLTTTGMAMGSPHYISPEQVRAAKDIDFRADIYSLGCMLYHMLTGQPPYDAEDSFSIMAKHVSGPLPAIGEVRPECPPPLAALLGRMLAKDRNARPQNYEQLIAELLAIYETLKSSPVPSVVNPIQPSVAKAASAQPGKPVALRGLIAGAILVGAIGLAAVFFRPSSLSQSPPSSPAEGSDKPVGMLMTSNQTADQAQSQWSVNDISSWVVPAVPKADRNTWITLFDGDHLFGCDPTHQFFTSRKVFLQNGSLWLDDAGCVFDWKSRNTVLRARVKKIVGRNVALCVGPYLGWFNGGSSFGISQQRGNAPLELIAGNSSSPLPDYFDMELTVMGGTITLKAEGTTVATTQAAPIGDNDAGLNVWAAGLSAFKRIEAKVLDNQPDTQTAVPMPAAAAAQ